MAVTSDFVLTIGNTTYDLRKVSSYVSNTTASVAYVRFIDMPHTAVTLPLATFEAAYQLSLNAAAAP